VAIEALTSEKGIRHHNIAFMDVPSASSLLSAGRNNDLEQPGVSQPGEKPEPMASARRWLRMTDRKTERQFLRLIATLWQQMRDGWLRGAMPDFC
jgi:hypothetical protein